MSIWRIDILYECEDKLVSHPPLYQSSSGLEVIDVIEAFTENLKGIEATDTGNIIKYICRWKEKNGIQDLKKARWYCQHLIDHLEKEEKEEVGVILEPISEEKTNKALERLAKKPFVSWEAN